MEIYIDEQERLNASIVANSYIDEEIQNRVYINTLGVELALKYLKSENIDTSGIRNVHSIKKILEEFDIADIKLPNINIDVRVVFDENTIFIPKSHFEYNIVPDIYIVFYLAKDFSHVKFLGFFEPQLINKNNANNKYYFIEKEKLTAPLNLKEFIENFKGSTNEIISETNLEKSENIIISMADYEIAEGEKKFLLEQLNKNALLRDKFIEFENFEKLSNKAFVEPEINKKETTQEISAIPESISSFVDDIVIEETNIDETIDEEITLDETNNTIENDFSQIQTEELELPEVNEITDDITLEEDSIENIEEISIDSPVINLVEIQNETIEENPIENDDKNEETISFDNIQIEDVTSEETDEETISLDEIEIPENIDNITIEDATEDAKEILDTISNSEDISEEISAEINSLENIDIENIEAELDEELSTSAEEIHPLEEIQPLNEPIDEIQPLEQIEEDDNEEIISLDEIPVENIENVEEVEEIQAISLEEIETNQAQEETEETSESFEDINIENIETNEETSEDFNIEEINETENEIPTESFGKNLLENLALEEQTSIEDMPIGIDDLLAEDEELNEQYEEIAENPETQSEIINETEDENIFNDEETLISEISQEIVDEDYFEEEDNNEETTTTDEKLNVLFETSDLEYSNEEVQIPGSAIVNQPVNNKKTYIIAAAAIAIIATASAVTLLKPKTEEPIEPIEQPIEQPISQTINEPIDKPIDTKIETNVPVVQETTQIKTTQTPKELKNNIANKPITDSYLTVNKLVWDVPDALASNPAIQNYLKTAGKSIKLTLSTDLLLATEYSYTNQVKVSLKLSQTGNVQEANIISGSGSSEIDNIVLRSVKDTLNVIKPPSSAVNSPNFNLNLIIYF